jgi:hypothetical protein
MSDEAAPQPADGTTVKSTNTTWGPSPGDALAPGPTPQAPEIPMSKTWPWVAGGAVAVVYVLPVLLAIVVVVGVIGLIVHWW